MTSSASGFEWLRSAVQGFFISPKKILVSSRPYKADANETAGSVKTRSYFAWLAWLANPPLIRLWLGLLIVAVILLVGITGPPSCSAGSNSCDAAVLMGLLLFGFRDLAANKVQFWVLVLILTLTSGLEWVRPIFLSRVEGRMECLRSAEHDFRCLERLRPLEYGP
ncbi:hypothetical protein LTR86_007928 [Recurvomyces mirabilis]|nr:hypothetical protein LTR86_007928 [Recurvomyces mirabilis]